MQLCVLRQFVVRVFLENEDLLDLGLAEVPGLKERQKQRLHRLQISLVGDHFTAEMNVNWNVLSHLKDGETSDHRRPSDDIRSGIRVFWGKNGFSPRIGACWSERIM